MSNVPLLPRIFRAAGDLLRWIPEHAYAPRLFPFIFLAGFLSMGCFYRYHEILFKTPQGVHKWRQTDCAGQAFRYMETNAKFLEPRLMNLEYNKDGRTCSDFPLLYYMVGKIWAQTGHAEWIFRGTVLAIFFCACFLLYRTAERALQDSWLGILTGLFMFVSPVIAFYACNYLMNVPALSFAVIGIYFFYRYHVSGKPGFLVLFAFFSLLGGLLKVSSLGPFAVLAGLWFLEQWGCKMQDHGKLFPKRWHAFSVFLAVPALAAAWFFYADWYNSHNIDGIFLIGTRPIWIVEEGQFSRILDHIWENVHWSYFRASTQYILFGMFLFVILFGKGYVRVWRSLMGWMGLVFLVFIIFFFEVLGPHDYYVIDFFLIAPLILLAFSVLLRTRWQRIHSSGVWHVLLLVFLVHNATFTRLRLNDQYSEGTWQNRDYYEKFQALEELQPRLEELGILGEDKVACMPDVGFNVGLYYLKHRGWNDYWWSMEDSISIGYPQAYGAKYLFLLDTTAAAKPVIQKNFNAPFFKYRNVWIYRMGDIKVSSPLQP